MANAIKDTELLSVVTDQATLNEVKMQTEAEVESKNAAEAGRYKGRLRFLILRSLWPARWPVC